MPWIDEAIKQLDGPKKFGSNPARAFVVEGDPLDATAEKIEARSTASREHASRQGLPPEAAERRVMEGQFGSSVQSKALGIYVASNAQRETHA